MIDRLSNEMNGGWCSESLVSVRRRLTIAEKTERNLKNLKPIWLKKNLAVCIRHEKYGKTVKGQGY